MRELSQSHTKAKLSLFGENEGAAVNIKQVPWDLGLMIPVNGPFLPLPNNHRRICKASLIFRWHSIWSIGIWHDGIGKLYSGSNSEAKLHRMRAPQMKSEAQSRNKVDLYIAVFGPLSSAIPFPIPHGKFHGSSRGLKRT